MVITDPREEELEMTKTQQFKGLSSHLGRICQELIFQIAMDVAKTIRSMANAAFGISGMSLRIAEGKTECEYVIREVCGELRLEYSTNIQEKR
jgi:hypothetical protein